MSLIYIYTRLASLVNRGEMVIYNLLVYEWFLHVKR